MTKNLGRLAALAAAASATTMKLSPDDLAHLLGELTFLSDLDNDSEQNAEPLSESDIAQFAAVTFEPLVKNEYALGEAQRRDCDMTAPVCVAERVAYVILKRSLTELVEGIGSNIPLAADMGIQLTQALTRRRLAVACLERARLRLAAAVAKAQVQDTSKVVTPLVWANPSDQ